MTVVPSSHVDGEHGGSGSADEGGKESTVPLSDASTFLFYIDVLFEHAALLTRLQWNGRSRAGEARALLVSRLAPLLARQEKVRTWMREGGIVRTHARRRIPANLLDALKSGDTASLVLDATSLALRPPSQVLAVPAWLHQRLHVGMGVVD
jgi:hypothetical protein